MKQREARNLKRRETTFRQEANKNWKKKVANYNVYKEVNGKWIDVDYFYQHKRDVATLNANKLHNKRAPKKGVSVMNKWLNNPNSGVAVVHSGKLGK